MAYKKEVKEIWLTMGEDSASEYFQVEGDYQAQFIDALKSTVPAEDRTYDPATKIWTIAGGYFPAIRSLARQHFDEVTIS